MARIAKSLATLREQVNAAYPGRDKSNDGWIGDAAHAARASDHNPNAAGVVQAFDITHDPAHGFNAGDFAERLRRNRDPRVKYIISNRRIANPLYADNAWRPYNGINAHEQHVHVSVKDGANLYDDPKPWSAAVVRGTTATSGLNTNIIATTFDDAMGAYGPIDHSKPVVSLPAPFDKSALPLIRVIGPKGTAEGRVADKGPWYDGTAERPADPYWLTGARPRAETDPDTNGAGIDLNPKMSRLVGATGKTKVDWEFVGAKPAPVVPSAPPAEVPPARPLSWWERFLGWVKGG